jgi:hypothetical protein
MNDEIYYVILKEDSSIKEFESENDVETYICSQMKKLDSSDVDEFFIIIRGEKLDIGIE